jgi:hypothetical protein
MSLLSGTSAPVQTPIPQVGDKKAKNKGKARARRLAHYEAGVTVESWIKSLPDAQPTPAVLDALKLLTKIPGQRVSGGFGGVPVFVQLFGENAKVGDKITIQDVFSKTMKGVQQMNGLMRKWAEKGTVVKFTHNEAEPFRSSYEIVSIG